MDFQQSKEEAIAILEDFSNLAIHATDFARRDDLRHKAQELIEKLKEQRFTIGVVGVFNCGKSTFLNALLGENVLSTYILPETATITTLRFSEQEYARIKYWDTTEWSRIKAQAEEQSSDNESFLNSIKKSEQLPDFRRYITAQGFEERIELKDLKEYTSANTAKQLSTLVREVEIGTDFKFCSDNVNIVDTPGLNDPVKMREHITEHEFLPACDLMLFILPAGMVFTDFDRRFIQRQFRRGRLHKMMVVVNKIDTLNDPEQEVDAIVSWARGEIKKALAEEANKPGSSSGKGLDHIDFFPLSAYQAGLHRTGQSQKARWSEEESRFPEFEEHLYKYLFQGERAREMQTIAQSRIRGLLNGFLSVISDSITALGSTSAELTAQIEAREHQQQVITQQLQRVLDDAARSIEQFEYMFDAQLKILESNLQNLPAIIERLAMKQVEAYLEGGIRALPGFKAWFEEEFVPFVDATTRTFTQQELDSAVSKIKTDIYRTEAEVLRSYKRMIEDLKFALPNSEIEYADFVTLLDDLLVGLAAGLATRELLLILAAELSAVLAGFLSGPVGWLIVGIAAIWQLSQGGEKLKNALRTRVKETLGSKIQEQMNDLTPKLISHLRAQKEDILKYLHNKANEPAIELQAQLERQLKQLEALREEKNRADFDDKKLEAELQEQARRLHGLLARTKQLA